MNIILVEKRYKTNIKNSICKLNGGKKNCWNRGKPIILKKDAFGYLQEVKRYLPEGEVSVFEFDVARKLFQLGEDPKVIVGQLISLGCCKF